MDDFLALGIGGGVVAVLLIAFVVWLVVARAGLRRADATAADAWAAIGERLRDRASLVDRLVERSEASEAPDGKAIDAVRAASRTSLAATSPSEAAAAEPAMQAALRGITAGSDQDALAARAELAKAEDGIQSARRTYNGSVREVQRRSRVFPGSMFARGVEQREFFEVDAAGAVAEPPRVQF